MISRRVRQNQLERIKRICAGFPEVDVKTGEHHTFMVRGKKFAYYLVDHHGDGRVALQCKAERGVNEALVATDSGRFFLPPYMAHHGWMALYLDLGPVDWDEIEAFLTDAYRLSAPKTLARQVPGP